MQTPGTLSIRLEKTNNDHTQAIAKAVDSALTERDTSFIAELAAGFPRMAVIAAEQKGESQQTFESAEQVLNKVIWGENRRDDAAEIALEVASLFDWIGVEGRVQDQAEFVARGLAGMSLPDFIRRLRSFRARGIISERGDFVQIGPLPLAARLATNHLAKINQTQLIAFFVARRNKFR